MGLVSFWTILKRTLELSHHLHQVNIRVPVIGSPSLGAVEQFFERLDLLIAALDFEYEGKYVKKRVGSESKRSFEVEVILLPSSFYIIHTSHTAHRKD